MNNAYFTKGRIIFEIITYVILVVAVFYVLIFALQTKGEVPIRYDMKGNVSGYGSPWVLLFLPVSMIFTNGIISLVLHLVPVTAWNMHIKVNPGKEFIVYGDMIKMMLGCMMILSVYSLIETIFWALNIDQTLLLSALMCISLFVDIIYYMVVSARHNRL